jgi:hypothetical protein
MAFSYYKISKELKKSNLEFIFLAPKSIIHYLKRSVNVKIVILKGHLWNKWMQTYMFKRILEFYFANTGPLFCKKKTNRVTIHDLCFKNSSTSGFHFSLFCTVQYQLVKVSKVTVGNVSKKN